MREAGNGATANVASPPQANASDLVLSFKVGSENSHVRDRPHAH
jgi:hypothetical protein